MSTELKRANILTVSTTTNGWKAQFKLTHKEYPVILSADTQFKPDSAHNATLQREMFRAYMIANAGEYGILWDPADRRTEDNLMPKRYDSDTLVADTAKKLLTPDLLEWLGKIDPKLGLKDITCDSILPLAEYNGKAVSGKYSNGCWSYAMVNMTATVVLPGEDDTYPETYVTMQVLLVSGQMKKPSKMGEGGYNQTSLRVEIAKDFPTIKAVATTKTETTFKVA